MTRRITWYVPFLAASLTIWATACSPQAPGARCVPGQSSACTCTSGQSGAQVCNADGIFGSCSCTGGSVDMGGSSGPVDMATARSYRYVFATKSSYEGNLKLAGAAATGLQGADNLCQLAAQAALLPGTYRAWLSDSTANALDRMTDGNPWYLVHNSTDPGFPAEVGPRVFNNKAGLQISPMTGINRDEYGTVITSTQAAWTGTRSNGQVEASLHCSNWATVATTSQAIHGQTNATSTAWTMGGLSYCMTGLRLYCLEQ